MTHAWCASLVVSAAVAASTAPGLAPYELRCEYAADPMAVATAAPRLSWRLRGPGRGQRQSAYQVLVASSEALLAAGRGDLWDTGKVTSDQSVHVAYGGKPLASRQRCWWKVRAWNGAGRASGYSAPARWEMALLRAEDWHAQWIGPPLGWGDRPPYFRHDFRVERPVASARIHVAGLGYYELRLNGAKVGDHVLDPAWTDYGKRVLYATYDVGASLRVGANTLGAILGRGWAGAPRLIAQLEVRYRDGTEARWSTGQDRWLVTSGPIVSNGIYEGETYDARLEKPGWDLPAGAARVAGDDESAWDAAVTVAAPGGTLLAQALEPIRVVDRRRPVRMTEPRPGVFVFDTGQNLAGWAELHLSGARGTRVTLRFAESLYGDGTVNQENLRKATATDVYVLRGGGDEVWRPRFTYHGFRYVQVEGLPARPDLDTLAIEVVRSSVEPNGHFASSNPLLDRIDAMVRATEASNLHGVPTDCPQRDERMGWMNDLTVRIEEALYNFKLARFYSKFADDVGDTQGKDGSITDTAPFRWGHRPADPVSASYLLLGWMIYQHYGDASVMARHFDGFRAWVDFLAARTKDGIVDYGYWGDWSPPIAFATPGSAGSSAVARDTPLALMSTGYLYHSASLLARMAAVLGKPAEQARYQELARRTREAFNRKFWRPDGGGYAANNQAANAFALFLDLVPDGQVERVLANLVEDVRRHDGHLTTGNLCTKYLLEQLSERGRPEVAYTIATQQSYPSWGFMLANGATTLWERWEHMTGGQMNSHNHPMMGSVGSWLYKYLAGIVPDPAGPGFKRFVVRPHPVAGLDWVRASYDSMYGTIESAWKQRPEAFELRVTVPPNSTATVFVPVRARRTVTESGVPAARAAGVRWLRHDGAAEAFEVGSGSYAFLSE